MVDKTVIKEQILPAGEEVGEEEEALLSGEDDEEEIKGDDEEGITGDEEEGSDDEEEKENVERKPYNDQDGLLSELKKIKVDLDWSQTLQVSTDTSKLDQSEVKVEAIKTNDKDLNDDFKREMHFYHQAQMAAREALNRLASLGIPTERPEDYFAEMVKSDSHMQKVRKKLLEKKDKMILSDKAKKQRQLKKVGKKIQQEVLQKRQSEKKKMLQEVDRMKKGKSDKLYGDGDDPFDISADKKSDIGKKRKRKDDKFGYGGRKRKMKKNSAESAGEMTSFKSHLHGKANKNKPMGKAGGRNKGKSINHNKAKRRGK